MPLVDRFQETKSWSDFILDEEEFNYCRDEVTIAPGSVVTPGMILAPFPAVVSEAVFVGTGGGTLTLADPAFGTGVVSGVYTAKCTTASAGGGTFTVYDPEGVEIDTVAVGVAFDDVIKFTIADGAPDFSQNDVFSIPVTGDGTLKPWSGSGDLSGIAIYGVVTADDETAQMAALVRGPASVNLNQLVKVGVSPLLYAPLGASSGAAVTALMALKIRAR